MDEFVVLLRASDIQIVVDVRSIPRSHRNPQFNLDCFPDELAIHQISYEHVKELGGLRGKQRSKMPSPNGFWTNDSFRNYADYALTAPFGVGLERLRDLGRDRCCVLMCAEAVWWRCHRRIIADYLLAEGMDVLHILGPRKIEPATLTPGVRRMPAGLVYPGSP